jgi:hypothetical protein
MEVSGYGHSRSYYFVALLARRPHHRPAGFSLIIQAFRTSRRALGARVANVLLAFFLGTTIAGAAKLTLVFSNIGATLLPSIEH